jgi:primosomal protein N' (replication factor Y)
MSGPSSISTVSRTTSHLFAQVVLERSVAGLDRELTYALPASTAQETNRWKIGQAVIIPLRNGRAVGYITGFSNQSDYENIKSIEQSLGDEPLFDEFALKIARWMSAYYHCSLPDCLSLFVPLGATPSIEIKYLFCAEEPLRALRDLTRSPKLYAIANAVWEAKKALSAKEISKIIGSDAGTDQLRRLVEDGTLQIAQKQIKSGIKPRFIAAVAPTRSGFDLLENAEHLAALTKKAPKQAAALKELATFKLEWLPVAALARDFGIESATLKGLELKGLVCREQIESLRLPNGSIIPQKERVTLTEEQNNAVTQISDSLQNREAPQTVLLQGVTASGKTEVYLAAIEKTLELGKKALVLVPEIALTAQTVDIFQKRFGSSVAILHSALSAGERFDEWRRAQRGDAQIVVGARSAVFAPIRGLGLIIIDEEHDGSYKQDKLPRYHARDVAQKRATAEGAVLVLGSATPSLESYFRAIKGEYRHVVMQKRATGRPLPDVEIVDMTSEAKGGKLPVLSTRLKDELCEVVAKGEQAILFLNRRGFATYVQCLGCGHVEKCPNCDVSLTHHRNEGSLRCHHCDHTINAPSRCPKCDGWMLSFSGSGTEKVQDEVEQLFNERGLGETRILRLDRDTTGTKGAHSQILGEFRSGKASVLIGTQMVTKGLDFPKVTLVGVISADMALNIPDFRASERTFQLLSQVAGRAGRGQIAGKVLIQTLAADEVAITTAAKHDFSEFVAQELEARAHIPNPPFSHIVNIISSHEQEHVALIQLQRLAARFQDVIAKEKGGTDLLGPVACPLARVKNKFRFHLLLRDKSKPRLHRVLTAYDSLSTQEKEGLTVDVDALTIL